VRHPIDTAYSQFTRWGTRPEQFQHQWLAAYRNLLRLQQALGPDLLDVVRYEDVVSDPRVLQRAYRFCGVAPPAPDQSALHDGSVAKWKNDRRFGFTLDPEVAAFARQFGYETAAAGSQASNLQWIAHRERTRMWLRAKSLASPLVRAVRGH
jgi:hypothetical protein